ncbi:AAA family ATPase [Streptomyces sp. NPDC002889]|uniref:helix-turn-helix transcriptional regulator n=1 Tax=Streptomyces sp. NPDC002889 TaxID=3364669 RepID=UPI0036C809F6
MKLSERDEELRLLDRLYAGCAQGKGAVVLMNGPVGCGKTALLQAFAKRATEQGGLFLSVTASASERLHLFGLIDQLVNAMRAGGMDAAPFVAEDVGVTVEAGDPQGIPRVPLALLQRISRSVREFAERRPVVLSVDDVHFADEPSLQCLRYLIRRVDSAAVLIVMNESSCHERELATLHAETLHLPYCHRIRLAPLTATGTADQLAARLGADPAREAAESWAEASGGNPLLLHALIEDYLMEDEAARALAPGEPVPGESFRHAYLRCLHRCEPSMLDAARALAVLGESATPSLVGDFLGDATSVQRSLAGLNAAGLLSGVRFRTERAQLTALADIPTKDLFALHSRAAELLHESGAPALAVAEQLMATHDSVRAVWRVDILREAARDAMDSGDIGRSINYLRHASGICVNAAQEAEVTAELAGAQWLIDPAKSARHLHQLSHMVCIGLLTGEGAMVPVKQFLWRGEFADADSLLRTIEAREGHNPGSPQRGVVSPDLSTARLWLSFCYPELTRASMEGGGADGESGHSLAHPSTGSRPMSALTFLSLSASLSGDGDRDVDGEEAEGVDQVLHGTHAGSPLAARLFALIYLIQTNRLDEAVFWSERLLDEPWIRRVPMRRALLETIKSAASLRRGDVVTAGESARIALELVTPSAWGVVVGLPLALAVRSATELGDLDTVMLYLNLPVPPIMFDTPFALPYLRALGRYHLAMGRPHTALMNFRSCGDLMVKWRLDWSELADWRNDAAAALLAMGKVGQARALIEEQLARLSDGRSRAQGIALRRLAATSALRDRPPLLQEAVRILASCGDRLELGRAQADLAAALAALERPGTPIEGRSTSASQHWSSSVEAHNRTGPVSHSAPYRGMSVDEVFPDDSESGPVPAVLAELTDAERRVAALAATGCTNREIAGKLFITVSTVEQHLTKIYRKLRVRSRSDLPEALMAFADIPCFPNGR